jgi:hypothetical protein
MTTGRDLIRSAMRNRNQVGGGLAPIKEALHVPMDSIHAFLTGDDRALTDGQLNQAAQVLWGGAVVFDVSQNLLCSANHAPITSMGSALPPYVKHAETPLTGSGPRDVSDKPVPLGKPRPALLRRMGWST